MIQELRVAIKTAKVLSTQGRKQIAKKNFALPRNATKSPAKGQKGSYPINDIAHARNALARVSQFGSPEERAKVRRKVYAKYPSLKSNKKEAGLFSNLLRRPQPRRASAEIIKNLLKTLGVLGVVGGTAYATRNVPISGGRSWQEILEALLRSAREGGLNPTNPLGELDSTSAHRLDRPPFQRPEGP